MIFKSRLLFALAASIIFANAEAHAQVEPKLALTPTANVVSGEGQVQFELVMGPFGIVTSDDGHTLLDAVITVSRLPAPETLGDYHHFVAWAVTPEFEETDYLGEVRSDSVSLKTRIRWNKFRILITAEKEAHPNARSGPVVLRAASSAFRMVPMMPCHVGANQSVC